MSLLLDALKKAAEQKAENSGRAEQDSSAETELLDQTSTSIASENDDHTQQIQADKSLFEETELDKKRDDKTIKVTDESISDAFDEDETQVITDEDVTDFIGDGESLHREVDAIVESQSADETELLDETRTEVVPQSEAQSRQVLSDETQDAESESDLSQHEETEFEKYGGDETGIISGGQETEFETAFAQTMLDQEEATEYSDNSQFESINDETHASLFEEDDTLTTADAIKLANALTEETNLDQTPHVEITKSLNLVGIPDKDASEIQIGRSEATPEGTFTANPENRILPEEKTSTQLDSTSTRTFAPDNYDRTLRKPVSDDASKLFAGLKSDTDVVMTPEYAKTMFRSKTSAKRIHNFKIYSGTGLGIFLVIAVLGILQIDQDTINIDNVLRPLKRDPMPGLIKNTKTEEFTNIFAAPPGSEVDATTLKLVENAEFIVETEEVVAVELGGGDENLVENEVAEQSSTEKMVESEVQQATIVPKVNIDSDKKTSVVKAGGDESATREAIQISSKSRITEKDRWLGEAYAAYQLGNYQQALIKYNAVLDVDPGNRNALLARAAINSQNNRAAEAIKDYRTLLLVNPKDSLAMASMIAVANYSPEQSETQLKLMIRNEPDSPHLYFALGNVFGAQNRWQEAQRMYFTALENNPGDPNYAYNLAVSLEHIAKPKVAIAYYEQALRNFTSGLATFDRDVVDMRLEQLRQL